MNQGLLIGELLLGIRVLFQLGLVWVSLFEAVFLIGVNLSIVLLLWTAVMGTPPWLEGWFLECCLLGLRALVLGLCW